MSCRRALSAAALVLVLAGGVEARAGFRVRKVQGPVSVLMLSDLHFDPFRDQGKVLRLAQTPAEGWDAILREPATPDAAKGAAAMQATCKSRGVDSDFALVDESLKDARREAAGVRLVLVSGDLMVHQFPCRYKTALVANPELGTPEAYSSFAAKTVSYLVGRLQADFPGVPVYVSLGNNDSGCGDYLMDEGDAFLKATGAAVAKGWTDAPFSEVQHAMAQYRTGGYYSVPLGGGVRRGRLLVLNDIFMSDEYKPCSAKAAKDGATREDEWLERELTEAGKRGEQVWVMGHIPPGIDIYNTARKVKNLCSATGEPEMFLTGDELEETLARHAEVIRLAIFGHTHTDELRLLGATPVKLVPSISPINGNVAAYTVGKVNAATAVLEDYTVYMGGHAAGEVGTEAWKKEYSFGEVYGKSAVTGATLRELIDGFVADKAGQQPASLAFEKSFAIGLPISPAALVWPQYTCSLANATKASFKACVCGTAAGGN